MAQKRMPWRESHFLRQFLAYFDKTSAVIKVSDRSKILSEANFKAHLEVEIRNLKVGALVFWCFSSLGWWFSPIKKAHQGIAKIIPPLPSVIGIFDKTRFYRNVSGRLIIIYAEISHLCFRSKGIKFIIQRFLLHLLERSLCRRLIFSLPESWLSGTVAPQWNSLIFPRHDIVSKFGSWYFFCIYYSLFLWYIPYIFVDIMSLLQSIGFREGGGTGQTLFIQWIYIFTDVFPPFMTCIDIEE